MSHGAQAGSSTAATVPPVPNLLVVDFDYFFPNPADNGEDSAEALLYRWAHREDSALHLKPLLWQVRAAAFLAAGLDLPRCVGTETFWERFTFRSTPLLLVADSNLHSGRLVPTSVGLDADAFDQVWLYDAHHDSGYQARSAAGWQVGRTNACEDWMLVHAAAGAALHVRYPGWRTDAFRLEPEPLVDVDRAFDDGTATPVPFDAVFLCRSGAWVPSWCDDQFAALVHAFPGDHVVMDELPLERPFSRAEAERYAVHERQVAAARAD